MKAKRKATSRIKAVGRQKYKGGRPKSPVVDPYPTGTLLTKWRQAAGLTVDQLAEKAGCSRATIYDHERGMSQPSLRSIKAYDLACGAAGRLVGEFVALFC